MIAAIIPKTNTPATIPITRPVDEPRVVPVPGSVIGKGATGLLIYDKDLP